MNNNYNGKLNLTLGCMFAAKSSELIRRYNRYTIAGKKCIMIKYKHDTRYDQNMIVTHDNKKANALVCEFLYEVDKTIQDYDVICIDEIQFYKDAPIFCDKWANQSKIVEVCGLSGTFNRNSFPVINKLIPLADDITFLTAICRKTGKDGVYTKLLAKNQDDSKELIGGLELYEAVDRETYFGDLDIFAHNKERLREFIEIYAEAKNKKIYNLEKLEEFVDYYDELDNCQKVAEDFLNNQFY